MTARRIAGGRDGTWCRRLMRRMRTLGVKDVAKCPHTSRQRLIRSSVPKGHSTPVRQTCGPSTSFRMPSDVCRPGVLGIVQFLDPELLLTCCKSTKAVTWRIRRTKKRDIRNLAPRSGELILADDVLLPDLLQPGLPYGRCHSRGKGGKHLQQSSDRSQKRPNRRNDPQPDQR